jgi:hypothetical protein
LTGLFRLWEGARFAPGAGGWEDKKMKKRTMLALVVVMSLALGACKKKGEEASGGSGGGGAPDTAFCETKSKCPNPPPMAEFEVTMCKEMVAKGICVAELKATMECMNANEKCGDDGTRSARLTSQACQTEANAQMACQQAAMAKQAPPAAP